MGEWEGVEDLRRASGVSGGDVPEWAFTVEEYMLRYGVPNATARGQLSRFVESGQLKMAKSRHRGSSGRSQPTNFYWTPEPPPQKGKRKG